MGCLLLLSVIYFLSISREVFGGSCREAKLCCTGRDSSCVVQKAPLNAIIEDLNDKPCYCDHACLKLGDCCTDFKEACGGKWKMGLLSLIFIGFFDFGIIIWVESGSALRPQYRS